MATALTVNSAPAAAARPGERLDFSGLHSQWLSERWPDILFGVILGVIVYFVFEGLRIAALAVVKRLCKGHRATAFQIIHRVVRKTSHLFLALAAARLTISYTDPPPHFVATANFLFTIATVLQGARWLRAGIFGFIDSKADLEHGGNEALANASGLIRALVNGILVAIAMVVILDNIGVNVTGLVAGLGIGGIAIGLAAQGIFSDLFASLSIIFDRPFRVGETINFGSGAATVERIGLKTTRLRAITGEGLIVSNAQLLGKDIVSYAGIERRRYTFMIGLIYQTPPDAAATVPDVLREIIEGAGGQFVRAGFSGFGASSLDFELQFDIEGGDMDIVFATRHQIGIALLRRFNELGLNFAYPTQTTFTADPEGRMIMPYPPATRAKS